VKLQPSHFLDITFFSPAAC